MWHAGYLGFEQPVFLDGATGEALAADDGYGLAIELLLKIGREALMGVGDVDAGVGHSGSG
ncbi:hypothetical protein D3C76_1765910 [compost metagenome]